MAYTTINKGTDYFNTKLYTGNSSTNAVTGVGFQPDFVWLKPRNLADHHRAMDAVRTASYFLSPNQTDTQGSTGSNFASFDSDGFTLGGSDGGWNNSSYNYVTWNWKANGSGSANTDGSTSSTVSANQTAGFSIVKYTNPGSGTPYTVGHGLGAEPKMIITKRLDAAQTWGVWHTGIGFGKYLRLDSTAAEASANLVTATSTTTFSTYWDHHDSGAQIIAYCFSPIKGYSKFGSYTGNGSTDGSFVYTGFKPAFLLIKRYDTTEGWQIFDNKRDPDNVVEARLEADSSGAENTSIDWMDLCSNGFKIRYNGGGVGASGGTYIYMAFAESPLIGTNNTPVTAR